MLCARLPRTDEGIRSLLDYLQRQVEQDHLRPVAPFVALQAFFGPIVFHLLTRPLAEKRPGPSH
jgi:hypothetical protein